MARKLDEVLQAARALSRNERRALVEALAQDTTTGEPDADITEMEGLGAEIWGDIDPEAHVRNERASWNRSIG